jgi:two-component system, sensor histidine kinase and response regulator
MIRLRTELAEPSTGRDLDFIRADRYLSLLLSILEGSAAPDFSTFSTPDLLLFAHVLQGLRAELLTGSYMRAGDGTAEELLEHLAVLEKVQEMLQSGSVDNSFLTLLSSMRGPELMVELAHDLRSPLTSILFLAETLRKGHSGELTDLQHRQLGIIYSAALTMVSMAGDVIELVRGGQSLVAVKKSPLSIAHTIDSIRDLVSPMLEEKEVVFREQRPEADQRLGYPLALSRVLLNLTTNAIKCTEKGFVEICAVEIGDDGRVEFSVRDSGSGIDPERMEHLFEPFRTSVERERIGFSGAGLGLSISRRLVSGMGGELEVDSTPGLGTRFYFTLDIPPVPASSQPPARPTVCEHLPK